MGRVYVGIYDGTLCYTYSKRLSKQFETLPIIVYGFNISVYGPLLSTLSTKRKRDDNDGSKKRRLR